MGHAGCAPGLLAPLLASHRFSTAPVAASYNSRVIVMHACGGHNIYNLIGETVVVARVACAEAGRGADYQERKLVALVRLLAVMLASPRAHSGPLAGGGQDAERRLQIEGMANRLRADLVATAVVTEIDGCSCCDALMAR